MRGYFPKSVDDFTKEQCEEYLQKYPHSLQSEAVRERLKTLSPQKEQPKISEDQFWNSHRGTLAGLRNYQEKYPNGKYIAECKRLIGELLKPDEETNYGKVFLKIIASVAVVALLIFLATNVGWISTGVAAGLSCYGLKAIWEM